MKKPILFMMLGVPGAGKTSVSEHIAHLTGAEHINSDRFRQELYGRAQLSTQEHSVLYKKLDQLTAKLLSNGKDVIYDANLNRRVHRQEKYDICSRVGATSTLIWINTPLELSRVRATSLASKDPSRRPFGDMPEAMFERIVSQIEPPKSDEPHIELDGTYVDEDIIKNALSKS